MTSSAAPNSGPNAPKGVNSRARDVWRSVVMEYDLEEWQLALLRRACQVMTDVDSARESLEREGSPVYYDRNGEPKRRPEVLIIKEGVSQELAIWQKLRLDPPSDDDVPV